MFEAVVSLCALGENGSGQRLFFFFFFSYECWMDDVLFCFFSVIAVGRVLRHTMVQRFFFLGGGRGAVKIRNSFSFARDSLVI